MLSGTPNANEAVVLISALVAGWASGAHPGIAAVTRYFAVAAAVATGMQFTDPDVLLSLVVGGVTAFAAALAAWKWSGIPTDTNVMDWRTGVRRAFSGADAGARYMLCYGAAAAAALFAASLFGVSDPLGYAGRADGDAARGNGKPRTHDPICGRNRRGDPDRRRHPAHLLGARIYDVVVGCVLAVAGTLAATWPRRTPKYG
jgi:hypothetical protein